MQPVYNIQEPLYDESGTCIDTIISVRHVNILTPISLLNGKLNQHATFQTPPDIFTEKEWEVMYLLLCNLSLKEISNVLGISVDAVNGRLRSSFRKTGVNSSATLVDFCRTSRFDNYIPQFFLKKGHIVITG